MAKDVTVSGAAEGERSSTGAAPEVKRWSANRASFAFVAEPQTNGVTERFNRTLKEQVIYGRHYLTVEEVRAAVTDFMDRYNRQWLVEKLGFRSPRQAFEEYQLTMAA